MKSRRLLTKRAGRMLLSAIALLAIAVVGGCQSKSDDTADLQGLAQLLQSGGNQPGDLSQMASINGENDMGNPMPGRAPGHAPLWPPRGDFGFFAPEIADSVDGTYTIEHQADVKSCPGGGTATLGGTQTVLIRTSGDPSTRTVLVSGGKRTVRFDRCAINPMTTITSGNLSVDQQGTAQLVIVRASGNTGESHTVTNLSFQLTGRVDMVSIRPAGRPSGPPGGPGGGSGSSSGSGPGGGPPPPPPDGTTEFDLRVNVMRRVLTWQGTAGQLERPQCTERSGSVVGTVTTNGTVREINRIMEARQL